MQWIACSPNNHYVSESSSMEMDGRSLLSLPLLHAMNGYWRSVNESGLCVSHGSGYTQRPITWGPSSFVRVLARDHESSVWSDHGKWNKHAHTHTLTWPWHVSVCVTWGSCSVQTSCYTRRMDTHTAGRPCGYAHVYAGWSPERTAYHTPQMYTVNAGKQVTMPL